jgi:uncharacterized protein YjiS (DUF1127 family)
MFKLLTFRNDGAFWPFADSADAGGAQPASLIRRVWQRLRKEIAARRAMQSLASLDDRMLRDIGIDRGEIYHVSRHGRDALLRSSELGADIVRWS